MRYSIATLLLVVLLVSAYFPLRTLFEPWQRARVASKYPMHALQADLSQLHDGDTIELASDRFPTLSLIDPNSDDRIKLDQLATITGMALPKNAELYRYKSYGLDGILTFQHGRLVKDNHDKHPVVVAQQRLIPTPNLWIRAGILPFYVLFASVLRAAWIVVRRPGKTPNSDAMLAR